MRIIHIAPNSPYNDYWGYQENLLPKYQRKLGHDVTVITTNTMHENGKIVKTECFDYILNDGVRIIRRNYKEYALRVVTGTFANLDVLPILEEIEPDFIFYHGLVSYTIKDVVKYVKKHPQCKVVEDNHMDYNIGNQSNTLKEKIIRAWLRWLNKTSIPYVEKVYGVTPWRKTYAEDYFGIPANKTDVLIMGADEDKVNLTHKDEIRKQIREKYHVSDKDFLIVTGGKIDKRKRIDVLAEACAGLDSNVKLLVFGRISDDVREKMETLISRYNSIIYVGWIDADCVYDYFFAADLVFFPGQHSVLWEQACASKVPCVFERWEGMNHVDNGGNSDFITSVTESAIRKKIQELLYTDKYYQMKETAESEATDIYMYSKIAEKSLECVVSRSRS